MELDKLLEEMRRLSLPTNYPTTLYYFLQSTLNDEDLKRACRCILNWLTDRITSPQATPLKLNPKFLGHIACQKLIDENSTLQELFQIKDGYLHFADSLDSKTRQKIIEIAKQQDKSVMFSDPIIPDEFYHLLYPDREQKNK